MCAYVHALYKGVKVRLSNLSYPIKRDTRAIYFGAPYRTPSELPGCSLFSYCTISSVSPPQLKLPSPATPLKLLEISSYLLPRTVRLPDLFTRVRVSKTSMTKRPPRRGVEIPHRFRLNLGFRLESDRCNSDTPGFPQGTFLGTFTKYLCNLDILYFSFRFL